MAKAQVDYHHFRFISDPERPGEYIPYFIAEGAACVISQDHWEYFKLRVDQFFYCSSKQRIAQLSERGLL